MNVVIIQVYIEQKRLPRPEIKRIAGDVQHCHIHDWAERLPHYNISANQPPFIPQILCYVASTDLVIIVLQVVYNLHVMNRNSAIVVVIVVIKIFVIKILIYITEWGPRLS